MLVTSLPQSARPAQESRPEVVLGLIPTVISMWRQC
jgi:hypothetical protein